MASLVYFRAETRTGTDCFLVKVGRPCVAQGTGRQVPFPTSLEISSFPIERNLLLATLVRHECKRPATTADQGAYSNAPT